MNHDGIQADLERSAEWCLAVVAFIRSKDGNDPLYDQLSGVIARLRGAGDRRGLIAVVRDLAEWGRQLSQPDQHELARLLAKDFGDFRPISIRFGERCARSADSE